MFGALLDGGRPAAVFAGAALTLLIGVACAAAVGRVQRARAAVPA